LGPRRPAKDGVRPGTHSGGWRPPALYKNIPAEKDRAGAEAVTRTGQIAGLAGLAALGGLAVTARTYRLTEQGQITDRYTKAIEQLGGDKLDVRPAGSTPWSASSTTPNVTSRLLYNEIS
jgi:hypothetical protein